MKVTLVELTVEDGPLRLSIYAHETARSAVGEARLTRREGSGGLALAVDPLGYGAPFGQSFNSTRTGEQVGQRDLAVTANTYTHVLTDET